MLRNVRIRTRLMAGFAILMMLMIGLSAISITRINAVNAQLTTMSDINSVKQRYAINFRGSVHDRAIALRDVVLLPSPDDRAEALADIVRLGDRYAQSAGPLDAMLAPATNPSTQELQTIDSIKDVERRTLPVMQEVIARKQRGDDAGAQQLLMDEARPLFVQWLAKINRFIDQQEANNKAIAAAVGEATGNFQKLSILLCTMALVIGGAMAWWSLAAMSPINRLADTMKRLAAGEDGVAVPFQDRTDEVGSMAEACETFRKAAVDRHLAEAREAADQKAVTEVLASGLRALNAGDLTFSITTAFPWAYDGLKSSFNEAIESLRAVISTVAASADQIRTGSSEITQASEELARRTEGSAANLEETSAAITQMDGRLKATALAAGRTLERANQTIFTVSGGRSVADDAVQAMGRVSDSAKGIDSVIEGLDKIAFQTRVLAMNAAVEAGRAGEAGRGFAVVADLVSALAMRAEEEAKCARDQLTVTQSDIVTAVDAVGNVDQALQAISGDVGAVHELLNSITNDNQAQAVAISEISAAVTTLDQATQQNAAMVEETSAAARNLMTEVNALADQAGQFTVDRRSRQAGKTAGSVGRKRGGYDSPIKPLPRAAVAALTRPSVGTSANDWNEF